LHSLADPEVEKEETQQVAIGLINQDAREANLLPPKLLAFGSRVHSCRINIFYFPKYFYYVRMRL